MKRLLAILLAVVGLPAAVVLVWLGNEIKRQSAVDEAQKSDVIVVLGAAEYSGRPSPVLKARLDHALDLFQRQMAPRILTTGGSGGDPNFTEGGVGRDYLINKGVPVEVIIVEGEGDSTVETVLAVAEIMRRMGMHSAILVSDGYHIYRSKRILQDSGLTVYGSPRPHAGADGWRDNWQYVRQALGYLLWRVGIRV